VKLDTKTFQDEMNKEMNNIKSAFVAPDATEELRSENEKLKKDVQDLKDDLKRTREAKNRMINKAMEEYEEIKEQLLKSNKELEKSRAEVSEKTKFCIRLQNEINALKKTPVKQE
jgi:uncharacterized coiled-coil DUF342 family protein